MPVEDDPCGILIPCNTESRVGACANMATAGFGVDSGKPGLPVLWNPPRRDMGSGLRNDDDDDLSAAFKVVEDSDR